MILVTYWVQTIAKMSSMKKIWEIAKMIAKKVNNIYHLFLSKKHIAIFSDCPLNCLQFEKKSYSKQIEMRWPGIEPGSTAWKAAMLTTIPPTLTEVSSPIPKEINNLHYIHIFYQFSYNIQWL